MPYEPVVQGRLPSKPTALTFKHPASEKGKMIRALIESNEGRIFRVSWYKLNGELRHMQARLGVKKNLKGGVSGCREYEKYIPATEIKLDRFRNINTETVVKISMRGKRYEF